MRPLEKTTGTATEWLARARSALALAKVPKTDEIYLEDLCYEAQQAAEKALKAALVFRGRSFRFTHDLEELGIALVGYEAEPPVPLRDAIVLSRYAVEARYPGPYEPVTEEDHRNAVRLAEGVVRWVSEIVEGTRIDDESES
jgi:HEPN domain-containing protein